jgi:hypothetical protein
MKFVPMKIGLAFLILWREKRQKEISMTLHMMCSKEKEKKLLNQRPGLLEQRKPLGHTEHIQRFNFLRHPLRQDLRQFQSQLKSQFQSQPLASC